MKKTFFINVNRHIVARNRRRIGGRTPEGVPEALEKPIRITRGKFGRPYYADEVRMFGDVRMVYDPQHPLSCGASAYIECDRVEVVR